MLILPEWLNPHVLPHCLNPHLLGISCPTVCILAELHLLYLYVSMAEYIKLQNYNGTAI